MISHEKTYLFTAVLNISTILFIAGSSYRAVLRFFVAFFITYKNNISFIVLI